MAWVAARTIDGIRNDNSSLHWVSLSFGEPRLQEYMIPLGMEKHLRGLGLQRDKPSRGSYLLRDFRIFHSGLLQEEILHLHDSLPMVQGTT